MDKVIFLIGFLFSSLVYAQDVNLLKNADFEARLSRWVKTGSSTLTVESAAPLEGSYSANWDASASGEFMRSNSYTIPEGLKGRRCSIEMEYLWDSGTPGDILLHVDDETNNLLEYSLPATTGGVSQKISQSFDCPTSGSLRFELESTADAASIKVDKMYLGSAKSTVNISQATLVGSAYYPPTINCKWFRTNTAVGPLDVDADCPAPVVESNPGPGVIQAVDNNLPQITVNSLPAGVYKVTAVFLADQISTSIKVFALSDGTTITGHVGYNGNNQNNSSTTISGVFTYTSSGDRTFAINCSATAGTCGIYGDTTFNGNRVNFYIERYPSSSAEALTLETTGSKLVAYHDNTCSFVWTGSSMTDGTADASCGFTVDSSSGGLSATAYGATLLGMNLTAKVAGDYWVCVQVVGAGSNTVSASARFQLVYGSTPTVVDYYQRNQLSGSDESGYLCGIVPLSPSSTAVRVQGSSSSGSASAGTTAAAGKIWWKVYPINQSMPAPVFTELQNLIKSGESGLKIYSALILNSGTPTVSQEIGGDWIASLTDNGLGDTTVNINSGYFTVAPVCSITAHTTFTNQQCNLDSTTATTSTLVRTQCSNSTSAVANDTDFTIVCTGK